MRRALAQWRWVFVLCLAIVLAACHPEGGPKNPLGGAQACSEDALPACEARLAEAVALGEGIGAISSSYAKARAEKDDEDPFAAAVERARSEGTKARGVLAIVKGAKDPGGAKDLPRIEVGPLDPIAKSTRPELLAVALAEAAELDYVAIARPDGKIVRAFGRDPLVILMAGIAPVVVDDEPKVIERDLAIERAMRGAAERASAFDYVGAAGFVDTLATLTKAEPPYDAQSIRSRLMASAIGLTPADPILSGEEQPDRPPEPEPKAHETAYYDFLRVRSDRTKAKAFERRKERMLAGTPAELRPLVERGWGGGTTSCEVVLPPTFDRPRDIGFAYLLPSAILPAGARDVRGRLTLAEWYPRYEKLVALVERTKTAYHTTLVLVSERGGASSIQPTGQDAHRRVDAILLKHARALEGLAKAKPGRVGMAQLGFLVAPAAYSDQMVRKALLDLARLSAEGSLAQSKDAWDVLANAFTGLLVSSNMLPEVREQHLAALAKAFFTKVDAELTKQTGWGAALAFGAELGFRAFAKLGPNAKQSVDQIARALEGDPAIAQPGLAALTSALARYAGLAADGGLGAPILTEAEGTLPARAAARASLNSALEKLAEGAKPDPRVLKELSSLADNVAATLNIALASSLDELDLASLPAQPPKAPAAPACTLKPDTASDPKIVRALAKLRDQRKNVLGLKALESGNDAWSKRARLVALLLSDTIDLATTATTPLKKGQPEPELIRPTAFFVSAAQSEKIVREALASFTSEGPLVDAVESAYALTRGFLAKGPTYLAGEGLPKARALLTAVAPLLSADGDPSSASSLILGLAVALGSQGSTVTGSSFVEAARGLYEKGNDREADMVLLAAVVATALTKQPLTPQAFELSSQKNSKIAWLFDFLRYARPAGLTAGEAALPPPRFRQGLDAMLVDRCSVGSTATVTKVLDAVERFRKGDRDKARADLDAALEEGGRTLVLPHVAFTFTQETKTRILNIAIDIGLAAPFVSSTGGLNVGGGFKTSSDPKLEIVVAVDSADAKRARDDTARYYVHANAVAGVYHFLSNDPARAERSAARALGAVLQRTWLYAPGISDEPIQFADASRATMALLAQQAIDTGRPLLGGSLLQVVRSTFDPATTNADQYTSFLDDLPAPLQGIPELDALKARAKKTLALAGAGMPCIGPKSDKAFLLKPSCQGYTQSVALRVSDSVAAMPQLASRKKADAAPGCKELAALDGFLVPAQEGKYEPEKLMDAVDRMLEEKKIFDAAFLLTRPRDPAHCSERVVQQMRKTAELLAGVAPVRADLLTAIVNCEVGAAVTTVTADLAALDRELEELGDASRQIQIGLFSAALSARRAEPTILATVVKKKGFLVQHRSNGPLLPIALILDHLASALAGTAIDVEGTRKDMDFLCGLSDLPAGADTCKTLKQLRNENATVAEKKKIAEDVIRSFSP